MYVKAGEKKKKLNIVYVCCLSFTILAFIFSFLAFVTPYWLIRLPEYQESRTGDPQEYTIGGFRSMGLWVACFDHFIQPEDYISKAYSGCWYIYYPEFKYIRPWINPPWFYGVQMLSSLDLICNSLALLLLGLKACKVLDKENKKMDIVIIVCQLIAFLCYIYIVVMMGAMSKDREWMPRFDHNRVGWSYAMAVLAGFFSIFSFIMLIIHYLRVHYQHLKVKYWYGYIESNKDKSYSEIYGSVNGSNYSDHDPRSTNGNGLSLPGKTRTVNSVTSAAAVSAKNRDALREPYTNSGNWKIPTHSSTGNFYDTFDTFVGSEV